MGKRINYADWRPRPAASSLPTANTASTTMHLPVKEIALNPDNPRDLGDPEVQETAQTLKTIGLRHPISVATREAYLKLFPEHAEEIGTCPWVVVNGNRRLQAARLNAWTAIRAELDDTITESADLFNEAVIVENIQRKGLAPLREALFLQKMLPAAGTQEKLAARIGKSQAYISQRFALLDLVPELQEAVSDGTVKIKQARSFTKLIPELQVAVANGDLEAEAAVQIGRLGDTSQREIYQGGPPYYPVMKVQEKPETEAALEPPISAGASSVVDTGTTKPKRAGEPERKQVPSAGADRPKGDVEQLPSTDPSVLAQAIREELSSAEIDSLISLLQPG